MRPGIHDAAPNQREKTRSRAGDDEKDTTVFRTSEECLVIMEVTHIASNCLSFSRKVVFGVRSRKKRKTSTRTTPHMGTFKSTYRMTFSNLLERWMVD